MRWLACLSLVLCACGARPEAATAPPPDASAASGGPPFEVGQKVEEEARIIEVLQAGSYTYIHYETEADEAFWLATLRTEAQAGEAVQVVRYASRQDFRSARLERDFPLLHFGRIIKETEP